MTAVQMMSPIETANCNTTSAARSRPEPGVSAADRFALSTCAGWKRERKKAGYRPLATPTIKASADRRKQDAAAAKIIEREIGVEECREGPDQQLDQRHRNKHRSPPR